MSTLWQGHESINIVALALRKSPIKIEYKNFHKCTTYCIYMNRFKGYQLNSGLDEEGKYLNAFANTAAEFLSDFELLLRE